MVGSSDAAADALEKVHSAAVAVAVVVDKLDSGTLEKDSPAVGRGMRKAAEEAVDVDVEFADMRWDTAGNDLAMELAKDNVPAPAAGYIEAWNTPFRKTSHSVQYLRDGSRENKSGEN
jgi:hypothetical protein